MKANSDDHSLIDPWRNFVSAEQTFRQAVRKIQQLPLEARVEILRHALCGDEARLALRFLHFVELPGSKTLPRPLTLALAPELLQVALQPGANTDAALYCLEMIADQASVRDLILEQTGLRLAEADGSTAYEHSDYDIYLLCGLLLSTLGGTPFEQFKLRASSHTSPLIQDLAHQLDSD